MTQQTIRIGTMVTLSRGQFDKARSFIFEQGRPLERALFAYVFEGGGKEGVLEELARFQNPDGGFGHAVEPDLRCPESSATATTVAFGVMRDLGVPSEHPLVRKGIGYLLATYDPAMRRWEDAPRAANDAPHAPWWHYREELAKRPDRWLANPRALIVGYLYEHSQLVPEALLAELMAAVVEHLMALPDAMEQHDLGCYQSLSATRTLPEELRDKIMAKLRRAVDVVVAREPARWVKYCLRPMDVVHDAASPFAGQLAEAVQQNLDFEIPRQCEDGAWPVNFSWGSAYPEAAQVAAREWRGQRAFQLLRTLRSFGRLAG